MKSHMTLIASEKPFNASCASKIQEKRYAIRACFQSHANDRPKNCLV